MIVFLPGHRAGGLISSAFPSFIVERGKGDSSRVTYAPCGNIYFLEEVLTPLRVVLAIAPVSADEGESSEVVETPFTAVFVGWATLPV